MTIGTDERQVTNAFGTFPLSTVTAIDQDRESNRASGIVIGPNHVLTAGHVALTFPVFNPQQLRATTSSNVGGLMSIQANNPNDPGVNIVNRNFLAGYDASRAYNDDIALFTTSNSLLPPSGVIGLIAFVDSEAAIGLTINTAGYPTDNVTSNIPGNTGAMSQDLVIAPGVGTGDIESTWSTRGMYYSPNVDGAPGQSGSGVWHTLEGDENPRALGVHTGGPGIFTSEIFGRRDWGVLITKDIYDEIIDQIETDSGTGNADDLPENAIIGSTKDDNIFGSYRKERLLGMGGNDRLLGAGGDDRLEGDEGVDQALFSDEIVNYRITITDPNNPAFKFEHISGTMTDGTDTTKDIEFGVFEFVDEDSDEIDDDGNLFFVPLQVDPDDSTKLKDGPEIKPEEEIIPSGGSSIGKVIIESPAWMFDSDVDYKIILDGSEQFGTDILVVEFLARIDIKLDGVVIDTITRSQLTEALNELDDRRFGQLEIERTLDGLEVSRTAENEITFDLVSSNSFPLITLDYKITTGQEQVTTQTKNGTKEIITFSVNQADFFTPNSLRSFTAPLSVNANNAITPSVRLANLASQVVERDIVGNDLDNIIEVQSGENSLFGNGGNDRFILLGGGNWVDGGDGLDTVQFNKTQAEVGEVSKDGNIVNVGTESILMNVEFIEFSDVRLAADTLQMTPILSLNNSSISSTEGDTGSTFLTFTVNLSSISTEDVIIDFSTRSDDANVGTDFVAAIDQLTIAAGESSGDITLEILGDTEIEGNETLFLDLSVVEGGTFAEGSITETAQVTIQDDDTSIGISVVGNNLTVIEGEPTEPVTLQLRLDRFGGVDELDVVAIEIIPAGNNPVQASDFVNGFFSQPITFNPGETTQTIDIAIAADQIVEMDETFGIRLTRISGAAVLPNEELIFTILNDDTQSPAGAPPVAEDDDFTLVEDNVLNGNVLSNDSDPDGDILAATLLSNVNNGRLSFNVDGSFEYIPDANFNGVDSFTYEIMDGQFTDSATVKLIVSPFNDDPIAVNDNINILENTATNIDLLINDTDVDGDNLTLETVSPPANGSVINNDDGTVTYTPNTGFSGSDTFSYTLSDGSGGSDTATVMITVDPFDVLSSLEIGVYDAHSDTLITTINDGEEVNASDIFGRNVTIAAFVPENSIFTEVESVFLDLNEGQVTRIENVEPYALFGDNNANFQGNSDDFLIIGDNSIAFDLYSQKGLQGNLLGKVTRDFRIIDDILGSSDFIVGLFDADEDALITTLHEGDEILASSIAGKNVTIAAFVSDDSPFSSVESIFLDLNDGQITRTENIAPYAMFGDMNGNFQGRGINLFAKGSNSISFDLYSQDGLKGNLLGTVTRNFIFDDDLVPSSSLI